MLDWAESWCRLNPFSQLGFVFSASSFAYEWLASSMGVRKKKRKEKMRCYWNSPVNAGLHLSSQFVPVRNLQQHGAYRLHSDLTVFAWSAADPRCGSGGCQLHGEQEQVINRLCELGEGRERVKSQRWEPLPDLQLLLYLLSPTAPPILGIKWSNTCREALKQVRTPNNKANLIPFSLIGFNSPEKKPPITNPSHSGKFRIGHCLLHLLGACCWM